MAKGKQGQSAITINLSDEVRLAALRTVLAYEAVQRGLSMSQTFAEMILEAVDVEGYPAEVREALDEIGRARAESAARAALSAAELRRSA